MKAEAIYPLFASMLTRFFSFFRILIVFIMLYDLLFMVLFRV